MTVSTDVGRLPADEVGTEILFDNPTKVVSALLSKVDELTAALKGLADKLDLDSGVNGTDYGSLWTDSIAELKFKF